MVEKQEIQVSFLPQPQPHIHIVAEYHLKNTGIRGLDFLDVHLPSRRFRPTDYTILWDGAELPLASSTASARDTLLQFPKPWPIGVARTIQFTYDLHSATAQEGALGFSTDAFDLPAEGWTPALPQARGPFGFGGVPPNKWQLVVQVPNGFLVHASGGKEKHFAKNSDMEFRFEQTAGLEPFRGGWPLPRNPSRSPRQSETSHLEPHRCHLRTAAASRRIALENAARLRFAFRDSRQIQDAALDY
jgi:hypothetical protein